MHVKGHVPSAVLRILGIRHVCRLVLNVRDTRAFLQRPLRHLNAASQTPVRRAPTAGTWERPERIESQVAATALLNCRAEGACDHSIMHRKSTYMHTYMHIYIHAHMHTYMHT